MLGLWLGTYSLAACPQLHRLVHQDAPSASHQCFITQLQQQHLLVSAACPLMAPQVLGPVLPPDRALCQVAPRLDCRLAPSRAPPQA